MQLVSKEHANNGGRRLVTSVLFALLGSFPLTAQTCSLYADFTSMTDAQLATMQVKLGFVGNSNGLMRSLVLTTAGTAPAPSMFAPCALEGFNDLAPVGVTVAGAELRALLNNVNTLSAVTAGGRAVGGTFAFSLANTQPSNKVFQAIVTPQTAALLFAQIRLSFAANRAATVALSQFGCSLGLTESGTPTNLSAVFKVSLGGVRLNRVANTFVAVMTVTNNSSTTPAGPVSVVLALPTNVTLARPDGVTCMTELPGRGFVNLTTIPAPGASVTMPVEFNNLDFEPLIMQSRVYGGTGAR